MPDFTAEQAISFGIFDNTLNSLLNETLISALAEDFKITPPNEHILKILYSTPTFHGADGKFSKATFKTFLAMNNLSEQQMIKNIQTFIVQNEVSKLLFSQVQLPTIYAQYLTRDALEKRDLDVITIDANQITDIPAPTAEEIRNYYDNNLEAFKTPEVRDVQVIKVSKETLANSIIIPEEDIVKEFDYRQDSLGTPERRDLNQLIVADKSTADKVMSQISTGQNLASVAAEQNLSNITKLSNVAASELDSNLAAQVFSSRVGTTIGPIQTSFGWHIVTTLNMIPGNAPTLDEFRGSLRQEMALTLAADKLFTLSATIEEDLFSNVSLEEIAQKNSLSTFKFTNITSSGSIYDEQNTQEFKSILDSLGSYAQEIVASAFDAQENTPNEILQHEDGSFSLIYVTKVTPQYQIALESAQQQIQEILTKNMQYAKALEIAQEIKENSDSATIQQKYGRAVSPTQKVVIQRSATSFSDRFKTSAFALERNQAHYVEEADGRIAVIKLNEVIPPSDEEVKEKISTVRKQKSQALNADIIAQVFARLKTDFKAKVKRSTALEYYLTTPE